MVGADARIAHRPRRLRGPTSILGPRVFLAVLVFVGVPGAFAAPFADRTALKAAVDSCLGADGDPTGVACCSKSLVDCGAAGTTEMADWDVSLVTDMNGLFSGKAQFNADISRWNVSSVTNTRTLFYGASQFNADISRWDTSSVTRMGFMFYGASQFNADISRWDVSSVTDMTEMFEHAYEFNADISRWDTSSVTDMSYMFADAIRFDADITRWDVPSYLNTDAMFLRATAWASKYESSTGANGPPAAWVRKDNACDVSTPPLNGGVGNCTDTLTSGTSCVPTCNEGYTLQGVTSCTDRVLTEAVCVWLFTNGAELKAAVDACLDAVPSGEKCCSSDPRCWYDEIAMRRCGGAGCLDMPDWDVSQVMDAQNLFAGRSSFLQDLTGWTFPDDAITTGMFTGADTWLTIKSRWDGSDSTDGPPDAWTFIPCLENERVENGLCASCTDGGTRAAGDDPAFGDTACAFPDRAALKTAVDNCLAVDPTGVACCNRGADCGAAGTAEMADWDVSLVTDMLMMFYQASQFNADISRWDVSSVKSMSSMFRDASKFNADISRWDVSSVTNTEFMFLGALVFNADISRWDVSSVTNMQEMFERAYKFNADLSQWDVSSVTNMYSVFRSAAAFNADLSRWDTSSVTSMKNMFLSASQFNADITRWDTSSVGDMSASMAGMFAGPATAWQSRFHNCGYLSSSHQACGEVASYASSDGSENGPPAAWVRKDNACDASTPPLNGGVGDCTDTLASGTSCVPTCNEGYTLQGVTSCTDRVLTPALCIGAPCDASAAVENGGLGDCTASLADHSSCTPTCAGELVLLGTRTCRDGVLIDTAVCKSPPFPDKAALESAVNNCIQAVSSGERCCSEWGADCGPAGIVDMPLWDVSLVTNMYGLFSGKAQFNVDISRWDVSSVTHMYEMFRSASQFNADISRWDVSSVTTMGHMFNGASQFNADISRWDTSSVTNMGHMFNGASQFNVDISRWDASQVTNMHHMFDDASQFNADVTRWDVRSDADMSNMFSGATAWQSRFHNCGYQSSSHQACGEVASYASSTGSVNGPPAAWVRIDNACDASTPPLNGGVGDCTDTLASGETCTPVCDYAYYVKGVTSCTDRVLTRATCTPAFTTRTALKAAVDACLAAVPSGEKCCSTDRHCANPLDHPLAPPRCANAGCSDMPDWNTEFVTDMTSLFQNAQSFNQDISKWDTSRVTSMKIMFGSARTFDGDLSRWDVSSVTDMENMFLNARAFSGGDLSRWNTSKVTKMNGMFADQGFDAKSQFNGDLSNWDVSSVTLMDSMFLRAVKFQGKGLSQWDVGSVTSVSNMFNGASVFKGDITAWNLLSVGSADGMFSGAKAWHVSYVDCVAGGGVPEVDHVLCSTSLYGAKFPSMFIMSESPTSEWVRRVRKWENVEQTLQISSQSRLRSAAISTTGKRVALAAADDSQGPVARVYELRDGTWSQVWSHTAPFGSLHMSAAGNRVVIGPQDSGLNVTVYESNSLDWVPVGGEFFGYVSTHMGHDVSLSLDGSRVAMSAVDEDDSAENHTAAGLVRVYEWRDGVWTQMGQDLRGINSGERFGETVSLSDDGARLVVASGAGFATVYRWDRSSLRWDRIGEAIPGGAFDTATTRACVSGDGGTVAVGVADTDDTVPDRGHVEVFRWSSIDDAWVRMGPRILGNGYNGGFTTVSLSRDGETLSTTYSQGSSNDVYPVAAVLHWNSLIEAWDSRGSSNIAGSHAALSGDGRVLIAGDGVYARSCDASAIPAGVHRGGGVGGCTASLAPGDACTPTCRYGLQVLDATCSKTGRFTPGSCASSWCEADVTRGGFATGSAAADDIGCLPECVADGTCISARYVRIYKYNHAGVETTFQGAHEGIINLQELAVWSSVDPDVNLAAGKNVTCSPACSYFSGGAFVHSAQYLVDEALDSGILHTCFEGSLESRGGLEAGACDPAIPKSVEIDLGQEYLIDGMLIVNLLSPPTDSCCRQRAEDLMVDFMDADRNVKLTTAKITSANHSNDAFIMDVRTGIQLDSNGESDAWRYVPQGSISVSSTFDWAHYQTWCATNEYWDGQACATCPSGSFSAGGAATTTTCTTSNATIWYSTADPSDVLTGSQGEVTGWMDATDNGYDIGAGAGSRAPTLETSTDGKYAVRVGGSSQKYLRSADTFANLGLADIPQPFTVMAVIKINSGSNYLMDGYLLDKFVTGIDNGDNIYPFPTTNSAWRGTGGASLTGNCGFPSAGWGVHEWVFSNTAGETAIYKADGSAPCIDDTTATMSHAYSLTGLTIGEDGGMRTNIIDADVSWREFMIIPGTLTREESARYREYLDDIAS